MNFIRLSLCFLLLSFCIGCRTPGPSQPETDKAYAIHAVFIDVPSTLLEELNLTWMLDSSKTITANEFEDMLKKLQSSRKTRKTEFPVVYVDAGERKKIDNQIPVTYPNAYTEDDGKPTDYQTRGVGQLIEIDLKSVTNGIAQFSYHIEDVANPAWTSYPYKIGTSSRKLKLPIFHVTSMTSVIITLPLNKWMIMGGLGATQKDGTKLNTIIGIQVQETKKAPPAAAH